VHKAKYKEHDSREECKVTKIKPSDVFEFCIKEYPYEKEEAVVEDHSPDLNPKTELVFIGGKEIEFVDVQDDTKEFHNQLVKEIKKKRVLYDICSVIFVLE